MLTINMRCSPIKKRAALATGAIAALAIAAPITEASAQLPVALLPPIAGVPAYVNPLLASLGPSGRAALGGVSYGNLLNGGTTVVVGTWAAVGSTNGSP